jgi:hypothetical protein
VRCTDPTHAGDYHREELCPADGHRTRWRGRRAGNLDIYSCDVCDLVFEVLNSETVEGQETRENKGLPLASRQRQGYSDVTNKKARRRVAPDDGQVRVPIKDHQ